MLLTLARTLLFILCFSPWFVPGWWLLKRRKNILAYIRGHKLLSLALAPVVGVVLLVFYTIWAICVGVFGNILNSELERIIPHDPPEWVGSGLDAVFNLNEGVEVLAGGDPGGHQYNEKMCDYLMRITAPAQEARFRQHIVARLPIEEKSDHPLRGLPYLSGYEDKFPTTHCVQFTEHSSTTAYNLTVYLGSEGYYYLSVWRTPYTAATPHTDTP